MSQSTQLLITMAQKHAAADTQHAYTQAADFLPHGWVVAAMQEAYEAGLAAKSTSERGEVVAFRFVRPDGITYPWQDACSLARAETEVVASKGERIEYAYAAQPKPEQAVGDGVVGMAMETVGGDSVAVLNDAGKRLPNRSPLFASPRPAVATPAEVTDEEAERFATFMASLDAELSSLSGWEGIRMKIKVAWVATFITAQCQVRNAAPEVPRG